jgi:hypothetical protein
MYCAKILPCLLILITPAMARAEPGTETLEEMTMTPARLGHAITKTLVDTLQEKGFAPTDAAGIDGGSVERWDQGVYMYIGVVVNRIDGVNRITPFAQLGFRDVKKIYAEYMSDNPVEANKRAIDLQVDYCYFSGGKWGDHLRCQEESELAGLLDRISRLASDRILPFLEQNADPRKVLDLYLRYDEKNIHSCDPPGWTGHSSALNALILARLYRPEHYPALKKRYGPIFAPLIPDIKKRAMRLISHLDGSEERKP